MYITANFTEGIKQMSIREHGGPAPFVALEVEDEQGGITILLPINWELEMQRALKKKVHVD